MLLAGLVDLHKGVGAAICFVHGDGDVVLAESIVIVVNVDGSAIKIVKALATAKEKICEAFDEVHVVAIPSLDLDKMNGKMGEVSHTLVMEGNNPPLPKETNNLNLATELHVDIKGSCDFHASKLYDGDKHHTTVIDSKALV